MSCSNASRASPVAPPTSPPPTGEGAPWVCGVVGRCGDTPVVGEAEGGRRRLPVGRDGVSDAEASTRGLLAGSLPAAEDGDPIGLGLGERI